MHLALQQAHQHVQYQAHQTREQQHEHQSRPPLRELYQGEQQGPQLRPEHGSSPPERPVEQPQGQQQQQQPAQQTDRSHSKPPRIVSYNYFESANEPADGQRAQRPGGPAQATNFQFGDSLLSASGDIEHSLSGADLEAIQSQFLTAEHPVVPLNEQQRAPANAPGEAEPSLRSLLDGLKLAGGAQFGPELGHQGEEPLKELASSHEESASSIVAAPVPPMGTANNGDGQRAADRPQQQRRPASFADKKKSLIVYLNHPHADDMTRAAGSAGEDSLAQLIGEQSSGDPLVSAREFDSHGLSKETKHLDVASLRGLPADSKGAPDKEGLSVVVIGDAYKYKKIVLLISAKSGGLKFIPMVRDMK